MPDGKGHLCVRGRLTRNVLFDKKFGTFNGFRFDSFQILFNNYLTYLYYHYMHSRNNIHSFIFVCASFPIHLFHSFPISNLFCFVKVFRYIHDKFRYGFLSNRLASGFLSHSRFLILQYIRMSLVWKKFPHQAKISSLSSTNFYTICFLLYSAVACFLTIKILIP